MTYRNYRDPIYRKWRLSVYKRDKFKCRWPGCKNKGRRTKIHAHHILKWSSHPRLRFELNNGITLCRQHHKSIQGKEDHFVRLFLTLLKDKK